MALSKEVLAKYKKASEVSKKVKAYGKSLAKPGMSYLELSEKIEERTRELGAELAFPANVSVNNVAAHYCASSKDKNVLKKGDLLKLDVGVQVDGYIVDSAISVGIATKEHDKMIKTARDALNNAIKILKPGVKTSEIGAQIEKTTIDGGFKVIKNLSGHGVGQYEVHVGYSIPNYDTKSNEKLKKGDVIAIEPFVTNGRGAIREGPSSGIYELKEAKPVRLHKDVLKYIIEKYKTLPFSEREVEKKFGALKTKLALRNFARMGILYDHTVLLEEKGSYVAQFEHTIIIDDKPIVLG